jgi:2-C-methyl-D-erythritol 4-phosphate cytidylyltransferase
MTVAAIVPAAGRGERLGPGAPKAMRPLGGTPMLVHAVRSMLGARLVDLVVVAAPPGDEAEVASVLASHDVGKEVRVIAGGATRQESVRRALESLPPDVDIVLVHDAARPLTPSELADAVVNRVRAGADAVVPGLPVADTIKRVDAEGVVMETLRRGELVAVQTPQGFTRELLAKAHDAAVVDGFEASDDAGLAERVGATVTVVAGSDEGFKVTRPADLIFAAALLRERRAR